MNWPSLVFLSLTFVTLLLGSVALRMWKQLRLEALRNDQIRMNLTHSETMRTLRIWTLALTHNNTDVAVVEDDGHLPDVFVMEDEDDDLDNVVYMDDDGDDAKVPDGSVEH